LSRLDVAAARFDAALEKLEGIGAGRGDSPGDGELAALREERDRLQERIVALEDEARSLKDTTDSVERRLDDAIAEIQAALAS
jgi:chromosome segregation ATPase